MRTRRELLAGLALSTGCARRRIVQRPAAPGLRLAPVHVDASRVIRTVTGLRPFRRTGFRVEAEKRGDQLVVHNYGHGGCGVTLSWGTAHLAVRLAEPVSGQRVAVIGAGAVGLATARLLQKRGAQVTVYTKDLPPNTTSNIAGAQWWPTTLFDSDRVAPAFLAPFREALTLAYREFQLLAGPDYGITWVPNYFLSDQPFSPSLMRGVNFDLREFAPAYQELTDHPFPSKFARCWHTMMINPSQYLEAVLRDFHGAGGRVEIREFRSADAWGELPARIVVNCTGLGARQLVNDMEMLPIKGQLAFLIPQPEINYNLISSPFYMFGRPDGVLLGGTHEPDQWSLTPDPAVTQRILAGHRELFQRMKS